jgi:hypothetical protein
MCIPNQSLDKKTRRLMAIGNIALVIGLLLWEFAHPAGQFQKNCLHAVCGFLLGLSITINLFGLRFARRYRENQT